MHPDTIIACPVLGVADHPWRPWHGNKQGGAICAVELCYLPAERHPVGRLVA